MAASCISSLLVVASCHVESHFTIAFAIADEIMANRVLLGGDVCVLNFLKMALVECDEMQENEIEIRLCFVVWIG